MSTTKYSHTAPTQNSQVHGHVLYHFPEMNKQYIFGIIKQALAMDRSQMKSPTHELSSNVYS